MKVLLSIPAWNEEKEIELSDSEYKQMLTDRKDLFFNYLDEELGDAYTDARDGCPTVMQGMFAEDDIRDRVCKHFKDSVSQDYADDVIECRRLDDDGNVVGTDTVSVVEVLNAILDSVSGDAEFDGCLSYYVESCLYAFVQNGTWHIEKDRIWFGPDDKPVRLWTISSDTTQDELAFWFEDDSDAILSHIGDFDECFHIWYMGECACYTPEMIEIREKCPINFDKGDTVESILEKATAWCAE